MPEQTYVKSRVQFHITATGTFIVDHVEGESPAEELKRLIDMRGLSWVDLYLHSEEFDWSIEATDNSDQEWFDRTVRDQVPADEGELYRQQADAQDAELRERDRLEREEIGDAMREQWEQR